MTESAYYENQPLGNILSNIIWYGRQKMFKTLMDVIDFNSQTSVLDVGVTCDQRRDSNFFEKLYPYPHNITAIGLEDASFLETDFPGLKYIKADGANLPFSDKSFDVVVCFAVIEHVGTREQQRTFLHELCRVGKKCFITTPNRGYPIEVHTLIPLLHWLPPAQFRNILCWIGHDFYSKEENLNLLSEKDLLSLFPDNYLVKTKHFRLGGMVSNLICYANAV